MSFSAWWCEGRTTLHSPELFANIEELLLLLLLLQSLVGEMRRHRWMRQPLFLPRHHPPLRGEIWPSVLLYLLVVIILGLGLHTEAVHFPAARPNRHPKRSDFCVHYTSIYWMPKYKYNYKKIGDFKRFWLPHRK